MADFKAISARNRLSIAYFGFKIGGSFSYIMAAKDGSMRFAFKGTFSEIRPGNLIEYSLADGRKVII